MKPIRLVPILLLLATACTQRVIVREVVYVDLPAAPSVQVPSRAPAGDVEAVLAVARAHLGRKSMRVGGQSFRYDCSGFTTGAYSVLGIDLMSLGDELNGANGVALIHGYNERYGVNHRNLIPSPGDVAYFDNTRDNNGNDRLDYTYDLAGRLFQVHRGGVLSAQYEYDRNGNRLAEKHDDDLDGTIDREVLSNAVTHDAQDRLVQYGSLHFTYKSSGELESRIDTVASETTTFVYDDFGNLVSVTTLDHVVEYKYDPAGRRIEKKVDSGGGSTVAYRLLWEGALRPAAMLDANNQAVATFVYGRHVNVPDYMVKGGSTYRIVTDQLGSVRLVVDASTGAVAQRMDYDAWGRVLYDSEPGFQPFGFAGGLYDAETGLVRFGARDYDPETGRWLSKDPIRFSGGLNMYLYSSADPVNRYDLDGLWDAGVGDILAYSMSSPSTQARLDTAQQAVGLTYGAVLMSGASASWLPQLATRAAPFAAAASAAKNSCGDHAARGIPQIARASNRGMLGQALSHLKGMGGTAAEKAAAFEGMAGQISRLSGGSWNAARTVGADGAHIFAGELGHAVVISPAGQVFLGNVVPAAGQFSIGAGGALRPIYDALRLVQ